MKIRIRFTGKKPSVKYYCLEKRKDVSKSQLLFASLTQRIYFVQNPSMKNDSEYMKKFINKRDFLRKEIKNVKKGK